VQRLVKESHSEPWLSRREGGAVVNVGWRQVLEGEGNGMDDAGESERERRTCAMTSRLPR
jgi:hypothetical protein